MTRNFQNFEIGAEKISARCFFDKEIGFCRFDFQFETKAAEKFAIGNHRGRERMTADLAAEFPLDHRKVLNVIDVSVRQEQELGLNVKRAEPFTGPLRRIKQDRSLWSVDQIAIRFENAATKAFVCHNDSALQLMPGVFTNIECSVLLIV